MNLKVRNYVLRQFTNRTRQDKKIIKNTFPVLEMTCAVSVESMLKSANGVKKDAGVNFASQSAWVEYDEKVVKPSDLQNVVRSIRYDLVVDVEDPQAVKEEAQRKYYEEVKRRTIWSAILAAPVVVDSNWLTFCFQPFRRNHHRKFFHKITDDFKRCAARTNNNGSTQNGKRGTGRF